jgi:hypothetical protein
MSLYPYTPKRRLPPIGVGNFIPNVTDSAWDRPHTDVAAASWLPLADTTINRSMGFTVWRETSKNMDYFVILPGKLVALTPETLSEQLQSETGPLGRMVPAGVRKAWAAASTSTVILEYRQVDVDNRIEDLTTGLPVTAGDKSYTKLQVATALAKRGLLAKTGSGTALTDYAALETFISKPVGVCEVAQLAWAGGDGLHPNGLRFSNYKRQHKGTFLCAYTLCMPHAPASLSPTTEAFPEDIEVLAAGLEALGAGVTSWITGAGGELTTLGLNLRYGTPLHQDYLGLVLGTRNVEHAFHLPITVTDSDSVDITSTVLKNEVTSIDDLTRAGDFYLDRTLGILFMYVSGGAVVPAELVGASITFPVYSSHTDALSALGCVVGAIKPGDLLTYDKLSNWVPSTFASGTAVQAYDAATEVCGQALTFARYPDENLLMVQTFWEDLGTGLKDRMPGSATRGFNDNQTYALGGRFMIKVRTKF